MFKKDFGLTLFKKYYFGLLYICLVLIFNSSSKNNTVIYKIQFRIVIYIRNWVPLRNTQFSYNFHEIMATPIISRKLVLQICSNKKYIGYRNIWWFSSFYPLAKTTRGKIVTLNPLEFWLAKNLKGAPNLEWGKSLKCRDWLKPLMTYIPYL